MEQGNVQVEALAVVLHAQFDRVVDLRLELEIVERGGDSTAVGLAWGGADRAAAGTRGRRHRAPKCGPVEVKAASLVATRIAEIGQHIVGRLEGQDDRAR